MGRKVFIAATVYGPSGRDVRPSAQGKSLGVCWRNAPYWLAHPRLLGLPLYIPQDQPHQLSIKKMLNSLAYRQSDGDMFSVGIPSSQMTLVCIKLIIKKK